MIACSKSKYLLYKLCSSYSILRGLDIYFAIVPSFTSIQNSFHCENDDGMHVSNGYKAIYFYNICSVCCCSFQRFLSCCAMACLALPCLAERLDDMFQVADKQADSQTKPFIIMWVPRRYCTWVRSDYYYVSVQYGAWVGAPKPSTVQVGGCLYVCRMTYQRTTRTRFQHSVARKHAVASHLSWQGQWMTQSTLDTYIREWVVDWRLLPSLLHQTSKPSLRCLNNQRNKFLYSSIIVQV